jgi:hypothetical protein
MMLIGTSLGGCLKSILAGEVSEDDVFVIVTRTKTKDLEGLLKLAEQYYSEGNRYARNSFNYTFDNENITLENVKALAARLYLQGKIHQPRNFGHDTGFIHGDMSRMALWMEVNPIGLNDNPAVIEAYEKYKVLDSLTK